MKNLPLALVKELRNLGHDVVTIQERGSGNDRVPDDAVLSLATSEGRAVITLNRRDFIRLHKKGAEHGGIIVCTVDPDFAGQARRIDQSIRATAELRTWHKINVSLASSRGDGVIPLPMECILFEVDLLHLLLRDLDP